MNGFRRALCLWTSLSLALPAGAKPPPEGPPPLELVRVWEARSDFHHQTGRAGARGWQADHRKDAPGLLLAGLIDPVPLGPGVYRMTLVSRRGHHPRKGWLRRSYPVFRLELWDASENRPLLTRELQVADYDGANDYAARWIEFSTFDLNGRALEPRVVWPGLMNGEVSEIRLERHPSPDPAALEAKARRIMERLATRHMENGFVVARRPDGRTDEEGDALTYTAFYAASLAWAFEVTRDEVVRARMEAALGTLHAAVKGTPENPVIVRYIDGSGTPHPKSPSKDVYTAFFLAAAVCAPFIKTPALRAQMRADTRHIIRRLIKDGLCVKVGGRTLVNLSPAIAEDEVLDGVRELISKPKTAKEIEKGLKKARSLVPFGDVWPGAKATLRAIAKRDEAGVMAQVIPTVNAAFIMAERVTELLREHHREDLFLRASPSPEAPGLKLAELIDGVLARFPKERDGRRVTSLDDLRVRGGEVILALHTLKSAAVVGRDAETARFYRGNLDDGLALLDTAEKWFTIEEDVFRLAGGNDAADRARRGYLSMLALMNLITLEADPALEAGYRRLLARLWAFERFEDNPLTALVARATGADPRADVGVAMKALAQFPEDGEGLGPDYWKENSRAVAERWGGGMAEGYAREALPVAARPRDSFLWQRNPRRLAGDHAITYPGTEYLFAYWFGRAHGLIPPPAKR